MIYKEITQGNSDKKILKCKGAEHRLTFTREIGPISKYFIHWVIPNIGATRVHWAEDVAAVVEEYNSINTVKAVLVDNISTNTGGEAEMVTDLEYAVGISCGKVNHRFASWKIRPLNQARWLTLAIWLICLWTRGEYPPELW